MTDAVSASWDHTYLLGWYDAEDRGYLTTWDGDLVVHHFVVTHCSNTLRMPLWDAPVPPGAGVHRVPAGETPKDCARRLGGYHAIGWDVPVKRREARAS